MIPDFFNKFNSDISWIKKNTIYLANHGSRAYGTHTPSSDFDYKGVCIPPVQYFLGSQFRFEQAELKDPDTSIYELRKFINLAASCNPNIIELLFVDSSDIIHIDKFGEDLLNNRDKFLSKRIKHTFTGYAVSQLKRLRLHYNWIHNEVKEPPTRASLGLPEETLIPKNQLEAAAAAIKKELDRFQFDFMEELSEPMKIAVRSAMCEMLAELKISTEDQWQWAARKVGLSDNFIELMRKERSYNSKKEEWNHYLEWKKNRNRARFELEEKYGYDTKHAYHLVRLMRMCREILTTGKVIVKRPDREELLFIRNGGWEYEKLIEFAETEDKELQKIYVESKVLPKTPDFKFIDNLCISLVERSLSKYSWYNIKKSFKK